MRIAVAALSGSVLDFAVARVLGYHPTFEVRREFDGAVAIIRVMSPGRFKLQADAMHDGIGSPDDPYVFRPTEDEIEAVALIEEMGISTFARESGWWAYLLGKRARIDTQSTPPDATGACLQEAAMRALVFVGNGRQEFIDLPDDVV